jgi:hypothetical protein
VLCCDARRSLCRLGANFGSGHLRGRPLLHRRHPPVRRRRSPSHGSRQPFLGRDLGYSQCRTSSRFCLSGLGTSTRNLCTQLVRMHGLLCAQLGKLCRCVHCRLSQSSG